MSGFMLVVGFFGAMGPESRPLEHTVLIEDFNSRHGGPLERFYGMRHEPNTSHPSGSTFPAEITEFGIYRETNEGIFLVESTTNIPLKMGTKFGYRYIVTGLEKEERHRIKGTKEGVTMLGVVKKYEHPTMKMPSGRSTIGFYQTEPAYIEDGKYKGRTFYTFDYSYELVPGKWTFTLFFSGEELVSKAFQIGADNDSVPVDATLTNK